MGSITVKEIINDFDAGKLTYDQFKVKINETGAKVHLWNPITDAHPESKGNNNSRNHLKYDCGNHPKGKILASIIKPSILAAISLAHSYWVKKYDKDAFVYDDLRLIALDKFLKEYISENLTQGGYDNNYKGKFMFKLVDIFCGLCKEDIYYRSRIFDLINKFTGRIVFQLTTEEMANIEQWH